MATIALAEGFEELVWVDSDTRFSPDAITRLRSHNLPIVGGICAVKGERRFACKTLTGDSEIVFGEMGGLKELGFLGTGFMLTRREVYDSVRRHFDLPMCAGGKHGLVPFFQPMVWFEPETERTLYLSEGYSFCERARQCGYKILADTSIRLGHIGQATYYWEDAGSTLTRYKSYRFRI